jgi:uncharacterized protein
MAKDGSGDFSPWLLVSETASVSVTVPLFSMERLAQSLASTDGQVEARLEGGRDAEQRALLRLWVKGELTLVCQRCLQPMVEPVDRETLLGLVSDEALAPGLPGAYEPLVCDPGEMLSLAQLIEDELLLALPVVARHGLQESCVDVSPEEAATEPTTVRPFAQLAEMLGEARKDKQE